MKWYTNPEEISSSVPVVPHCTGTESVISWSQKNGRNKHPATSSEQVREYLSSVV